MNAYVHRKHVEQWPWVKIVLPEVQFTMKGGFYFHFHWAAFASVLAVSARVCAVLWTYNASLGGKNLFRDSGWNRKIIFVFCCDQFRHMSLNGPCFWSHKTQLYMDVFRFWASWWSTESVTQCFPLRITVALSTGSRAWLSSLVRFYYLGFRSR